MTADKQAAPPVEREKLLPCPFCGMAPSDDLIDTLYPSGRWREDDGFRHYLLPGDKRDGHGRTWRMHCQTDYGGCGATCSGDSEAEAIAAWNRRPPIPAGQEVLTPLSIHERQAVLGSLKGLLCLIDYHDCKEVEADAMEPGWGEGNAKRALELLAIGREIIDRDPELWYEDQIAPFKLRQSEINAGKTIPKLAPATTKEK